jgi:D-lactate dehydrogenase (cytochrome)
MATDASGTTTVRYGSMRENVLAAECVFALPDKETGTPQVVQLGTNALKNAAGYDLLSLLCGSEGPLGVIASVTVKLHPIPEHVLAIICQFKTLHEAAQAVMALKLLQIPLVRCELLDAVSVQAYNAYNNNTNNNSTLAAQPTLFLELQCYSDASLQDHVTIVQDLCVDDFGGSQFQFAKDESERKLLWAARHSLYYASIAYRTGATRAIVTDACVPLSQLARALSETAEDLHAHEIVASCFGHAGDGNYHVILPIRDDDDEAYMKKLHDFNDRLVRRTIKCGGTASGEHGIGYGKIRYLQQQYGASGIHVMKAIKDSLDPFGIMNPGKVVPC